MKTSLNRLATLSVALLALFLAPLGAPAQNTNKSPVEKKASTTVGSEKPAKGGPFHGKLAALDKVGKTITVGKRTFQITSETKIKKSGKPATLEDGVVGETVSGYVKPSGQDKLIATTVNFGPKVTATAAEKGQSTGGKETQPK